MLPQPRALLTALHRAAVEGAEPFARTRDAVQEWVRVQAAEGFAQLDAGEFENLSREELMARLAQRRAAGSCN